MLNRPRTKTSLSLLTGLVILAAIFVGPFVLVARAAPVDFTVWDFEGETTNPSTDLTGNAVANRGSGLVVPSGGSFPAGNGSTDSWSFRSWTTGSSPDTTDYFEFKVDLTNYGHITLSFDEKRSFTGIRDFEVHYSTNGTTFTQIPATVTNVLNNDSWRSHSFDFGSGTTIDLAIRGQSNVYFRIYGYNAEGSTGTWRIDDVTFNAATGPTAVTLSSFTARPITSQASFSHWQWLALAVGLVSGGGAVARRLLGQ